MHEAEKGVFISLEGIDSVGKTAHASRLAYDLGNIGRSVVAVKDPPDFSPWGNLREQFQHGERTARIADTHLFLASSLDNFNRAVVPALQSGRDVVADRSMDSWLAYQSVCLADHFGSIDRALQHLLDMQGHLIQAGFFRHPDITLWIADDPRRAMMRSEALGKNSKFETLTIQQKVAAQYRAIADLFPERITRIDIAGRDEASVYQEVKWHAVQIIGNLATRHSK
jgi:dTMP kinase